MSLKEQLAADLKAAMKEKDVVRKNTVQLVRTAILQFEKDNKAELDDEGVIEIIAKEVKKRRDVIPEYEKGGRQDAVDSLNQEIAVLLPYLPEQLSEAEIEQLVIQAIGEVSATSMKDIGKVMAALMPKTKGRADGKAVNTMVRKHLS